MSDDLVNLCRRLSRYAHAQLSAKTLERIADRIEKLEANRLANKIAIMQLEAEVRKFTETGKTQTNPADLGAGLPNSVSDTSP